MIPISLELTKWKMIGGSIALAFVLAAAAAAGSTVNGWRLDADHQRVMAAEKSRYDALVDTVREQNRAVTAMKAASDSADERRKLAEQYASGIITRIGTRTDSVNNSKATNCDGVLSEAWGRWK